MTTRAFGKQSKSQGPVRLALLVLNVFIASRFGAAQASSPKVEKALSQPLISASEVEGAAEPWERCIKRLLVGAGVSGGIVEDERALEKRPEKPSPKGARLSGKKVLDRLTEQNAAYKWEVAGESINVLPRDLGKEPLMVLNARVDHFSTRARSATVAIRALLKAQKFPVRVDSRYLLGGIKPKNIPQEREFSCDDKTVMECMNDFTSQDGTLFWHLYFHWRMKAYVLTSDEKERP